MKATSKEKPTNGKQYCPDCKKIQKTKLVLYDPDRDTEPNCIICCVCEEPIDFIGTFDPKKYE